MACCGLTQSELDAHPTWMSDVGICNVLKPDGTICNFPYSAHPSQTGLIGSDALIVKDEALIDEIQSYKAIMNKKLLTIGQTDLQPYQQVTQGFMKEVRAEISEFNGNLSELIRMFKKVYSRELEPLQASEVSDQQYYMFSFYVLRANHFVETTAPNVQFENVLRLSTERILSLLQEENTVHVDEVSHIQPISREVLRTLLQLIIEEVSVDKSSLQHVHIQDEITYFAKDIDNKNYSGTIDEGVVDTVVGICVLPWEDKNPMKKVENSNRVTQESNPIVTQERGMTTFGKKAISESALQVISQVYRLRKLWGLVKKPILYGILTNGLEWIIVAYADGEWIHTSVINTSKVSSSTGKGVIDADGISCLAKAIRKVLLN
eukprot:gene33667-45088_t